jgi:hypothetical protein
MKYEQHLSFVCLEDDGNSINSKTETKWMGFRSKLTGSGARTTALPGPSKREATWSGNTGRWRDIALILALKQACQVANAVAGVAGDHWCPMTWARSGSGSGSKAPAGGCYESYDETSGFESHGSLDWIWRKEGGGLGVRWAWCLGPCYRNQNEKKWHCKNKDPREGMSLEKQACGS